MFGGNLHIGMKVCLKKIYGKELIARKEKYMVFRTVNIQKKKSYAKQRYCDYTFRFFIDREYDEVLSILQDAMQIFNSDNIYDGEYTILRENNEIGVLIKDFPNRKRRKLEKDLKRFSDRLLGLIGILYVLI